MRLPDLGGWGIKIQEERLKKRMKGEKKTLEKKVKYEKCNGE